MITETEIVVRLLLSAVFGGIIGLEREIRSRSAGLRTHALVGLGSTMFMIVSQYMWFIYGSKADVDPSRIAAQIITGIGFIGAGTIMKSRFTMKGLTTAASVWTVASIGMAVGAGLYKIGFAATAVAILILTLLEKVEPLLNRNWYNNISISAVEKDALIGTIKSIINEVKGEIKSFSLEKDKEKGTLEIFATVKFKKKNVSEDITKKLADVDGVRKVKCE